MIMPLKMRYMYAIPTTYRQSYNDSYRLIPNGNVMLIAIPNVRTIGV